MAFESWQIAHMIGVLLGILIGWRFNPWLGAAFIWAFVAGVEVYSWMRKRTGRAEVRSPDKSAS